MQILCLIPSQKLLQSPCAGDGGDVAEEEDALDDCPTLPQELKSQLICIYAKKQQHHNSLRESEPERQGLHFHKAYKSQHCHKENHLLGLLSSQADSR